MRKDTAKKDMKAWCMKSIPRTGDRILRGKSLEEGTTENVKTVEGEENNPEGGEGVSENREKGFMRNWLGGQVQRQDREGRNRQAQQQDDVGGQEKFQTKEKRKQKREKCQHHHPGRKEQKTTVSRQG